MPLGRRKRAAPAAPSLDPAALARPAKVDTRPAGVIFLTVCAASSVTYTLPVASTATPAGTLNRAAEPGPSLEPIEPARPANVLTTPAGVILRMMAFSRSATKRLPAASTATATGLWKRASDPFPSREPIGGVVPAKTVKEYDWANAGAPVTASAQRRNAAGIFIKDWFSLVNGGGIVRQERAGDARREGRLAGVALAHGTSYTSTSAMPVVFPTPLTCAV